MVDTQNASLCILFSEAYVVPNFREIGEYKKFGVAWKSLVLRLNLSVSREFRASPPLTCDGDTTYQDPEKLVNVLGLKLCAIRTMLQQAVPLQVSSTENQGFTLLFN